MTYLPNTQFSALEIQGSCKSDTHYHPPPPKKKSKDSLPTQDYCCWCIWCHSLLHTSHCSVPRLQPAYTDNTQSHYLTLMCEDRTETAKLSSLKLFWLPQENTTWGGGEVGPGGHLMCLLGLLYIMCLLFARSIKTRLKNDAQRSQVIWVRKNLKLWHWNTTLLIANTFILIEILFVN